VQEHRSNNAGVEELQSLEALQETDDNVYDLNGCVLLTEEVPVVREEEVAPVLNGPGLEHRGKAWNSRCWFKVLDVVSQYERDKLR